VFSLREDHESHGYVVVGTVHGKNIKKTTRKLIRFYERAVAKLERKLRTNQYEKAFKRSPLCF